MPDILLEACPIASKLFTTMQFLFRTRVNWLFQAIYDLNHSGSFSAATVRGQVFLTAIAKPEARIP
jgi:hypothetical protein